MNDFTDTFGRRLPKQRPWRDEPASSDAWAGVEAALNRYFDAEIAVLEAAAKMARSDPLAGVDPPQILIPRKAGKP